MENPSTRSDATTELPQPTSPSKRAGRIWARALLILVVLLAALSGVWFLGVRPSLHHQALMQVERNWTQATVEALQTLSTVPPGPRNILVSERSINTFLNSYHTAQSPDWQVTVTPANIHVRFAGCDQNCTFTAILEIGDYGNFRLHICKCKGCSL